MDAKLAMRHGESLRGITLSSYATIKYLFYIDYVPYLIPT